ncbi:toprim domain-containing protein [Neisseria canis]|uniref:Protein TopB n=1 Tax=Neisseria canis TaxID=493 RepID=A0A448D9G9_9NEIS|nr:toprim domain-containing protein [Neisseria canis]VEF02372.1 protein TopB [Neisseria canis]
MRLFLCEKPSQAKDIGKVLGVLSGRHDGYYCNGDTVVTWAFGHILKQAFPSAYGQEYADFAKIDALPLLPQEWLMEVSETANKQFRVIKGLLAKADEVIIATDADREGDICPDCGTGLLRQKHIKDEPEKKYLGCSNFPECKHFEWCQ